VAEDKGSGRSSEDGGIPGGDELTAES